MKDKAYGIARNGKYDGYQISLASMAYKSFDKKTRSGGIKSLLTRKQDQERESLRDLKIWAVDLSEMGSLPSKNKNVHYLLCVIHVFTKYVCVKPLKVKKM